MITTHHDARITWAPADIHPGTQQTIASQPSSGSRHSGVSLRKVGQEFFDRCTEVAEGLRVGPERSGWPQAVITTGDGDDRSVRCRHDVGPPTAIAGPSDKKCGRRVSGDLLGNDLDLQAASARSLEAAVQRRGCRATSR